MNCEYCGAPVKQAVGSTELFRELQEENIRLRAEVEDLIADRERDHAERQREYQKHKKLYDLYMADRGINLSRRDRRTRYESL